MSMRKPKKTSTMKVKNLATRRVGNATARQVRGGSDPKVSPSGETAKGMIQSIGR